MSPESTAADASPIKRQFGIKMHKNESGGVLPEPAVKA